MPDICLELILKVSTHALPTRQHAFRWMIGDVHRVYPASEMGIKSGSDYTFKDTISPKSRMGFLFVTDAIGSARQLTQPSLIDIGTELEPNRKQQRRREWNVELSELPVLTKQTMQDSAQGQCTWPELKAACRRKIVADRFDRSIDTFAALKDSDVG